MKDWIPFLLKDQLVTVPRAIGTRVARKSGPQQTKKVNPAASIIGKYLTALKAKPNDEHLRQTLGDLCDHIVEGNREASEQEERTDYGEYPFSDEAIGVVVEALAALGQITKLTEAMTCVEDRLPPTAIKALLNLGPALPRDA